MWLQQKYVVEKLSTRKIADICKVGYATIWRYLKEFDIPTRELSSWKHKLGAPMGNKNCVGRMLSDETKQKISIAKGGENHPLWKGGGVGYYARIARGVWKKHWREEVPKGYLVHHVDRNIKNNNICNLALLTRAFHNILHKTTT